MENSIVNFVVPEEIRTQVAELQEKITSGEIVVDSAKAMTAEEIGRLEKAADQTGVKILGADMFRFAVKKKA